MTNESCVNGCQKSLSEIDERLSFLAPQCSRKLHREVIRNEVDELLDQRNLVCRMMAELALDEYVEMMENGR